MKTEKSIYIKLICLNYSSSYGKVHKLLETCALVTKTSIVCIEILQDEVMAQDELRVQSAYKSLVKIYMTCCNIERTWLTLFRKAFESVVSDKSFHDHCKVYIKYLKILRHLKEYETLLKCSVQMLELYPTEYIPLDMICWVYVNKYYEKDLNFDVSMWWLFWVKKMAKIFENEIRHFIIKQFISFTIRKLYQNQ